jgi:hypothetical protein
MRGVLPLHDSLERFGADRPQVLDERVIERNVHADNYGDSANGWFATSW